MKTFILIAWRNIWRNKRRTGLTASAIAFSLIVTINVLALNDGSHWAMIRNSLEMFSGYAQVQKAPAPRVNLEEILDWPSLIEELKAPPSPAVKRIAERLNAAGREALKAAGAPNIERKRAFVQSLNSLSSDRELYSPKAFRDLRLDEDARQLLAVGLPKLGDGELQRLNRRLLESVFPRQIAAMAEKGYQKEPSVEKCLPYTAELRRALQDTEKVVAFAPRLQCGALIASEDNSAGGMVVGIDPELEPQVSTISRKVAQGEFLAAGDRKVCLIGHQLARNLEVQPGMKVVAMTQGVDGSTGALKFRVKGILRTGIDEMDRVMVFVPLDDVRYLINAEEVVHTVVLSVERPDDVDQVVADLESRLPSDTTAVLGWRELVPDLIEFIELDDAFGDVFLAIVLLVVVFSVLSAVLTSVLERTHEFGLMLALGTRPRQIVAMVLAETLLLTAVGLAVGVGVGLAIAYYFQLNPIDLPATSEDVFASYGMENKLYFAIYPVRVAHAVLFLVSLTLLFSLYPARKAARLRPDEALRSVNQ